MDSKKISEAIAKITDYLDNIVQEGIPVVRYIDETMDSDGIKVGEDLIIQEIDGDIVLERVTEVPATRFDPGDTFYEEIAITSSIDEILPVIKLALEDNQEQADTLAWLDYENEIEEIDEDEDEL